MAFDPSATPLDEIHWRAPIKAEGGLHNNSVLYYFAESPFFDKTSNNEVVFQQGLNNQHMWQYLETREAFESRLRSMSGLEFIVAQEPAETGPGAGTGIWVINKQTRRKRQGEDDEVIVHATYFLDGENIYIAPTLADILSSRIAAISNSIEKILPIANSVQTWTPAQGRVYQAPTSQQAGTASGTGKNRDASKDGTPMLEGMSKAAPAAAMASINTPPDMSLVEESLMIHERYGGDYMDENPITGKPGDFHLSSTGRKDKHPQQPGGGAARNAAPLTLKDAALPALDTKVGGDGNANNPLAKNANTGKETKSPKTPGLPKPKRRKSKIGSTPS
ncbi:MED6 mediator sub complex component-domain-containing protein [Lasiosphaeria miniovina]|uniref:Mediator of RNA polymerase II transcription subunit 6 n=1 Tax=Lasiosphaeria miniovina TaxID=1954250 RepID=A0AA40B4C2_9PEZI|nr:MED6 mediator sub complex component-domain-containing protein [Lasiosphaeria miniovina]KAK0727344.1 MED6 mediator sub complex component-domain-containing protein [Lasiosphaeria miniovina]